MKINKIIAIGLSVVLAAVFFIWEHPHPPELPGASAQEPSAVAVRVARVESRATAVFAEAVGTVRSRRQTQIAARVLAEVKEILKQPGDAVEAGETLVILDNRDLKAAVEQAEATLDSLDETLKQAQTEFDRKKNLLAKEATTQQEFDFARFGLAAAKARRQAAEKALEGAKVQLGYATITAPFQGVIYEKHADPGDLAAPGKPLLGLYDTQALRLEAHVEESFLWKLKVGDELRAKIDVLSQTLTVRVSEAVPAVDPSTRTGTVKVDLPADLNLKPGMFGRVRIPVSERKAILIPYSAVVHRGQLEFVFALEPRADAQPGGTHKVRMLLVRLGAAADACPWERPEELEAACTVEVVSGLTPGQELVVSGAEDLVDGAIVTVAGRKKAAGEQEGSR